MKKYSVIIIDDEQAIGEYVTMKLEESEPNFECKYISNPLKTLRLSSSPDLFIIDIVMPEINGIDLAERLRQIDIFKNTPIIFYSSERGTEEKLRVFSDKVKALAFVNKNEDGIESLLNEIKSIFWKNVVQTNSKDLVLLREAGKALEHHSGQLLQVIKTYAELIDRKLSKSDDEISRVLASYSKHIVKNTEKLKDTISGIRRVKSLELSNIGEGDKILNIMDKNDKE
ncbi:MAG: response regulator [Candidatus Delongbacteria bacterium]|nr:response regulator [Candidatus Delongbacteria bacterium]MBN2834914.1 response regulator [Candidatus Delongbacteria bacterium]